MQLGGGILQKWPRDTQVINVKKNIGLILRFYLSKGPYVRPQNPHEIRTKSIVLGHFKANLAQFGPFWAYFGRSGHGFEPFLANFGVLGMDLDQI